MSSEEYDVGKVHAILSNTSIELSQLFWDVPREIQIRKPVDGGWSPLEILIHLRQVSEVYAARVKRVFKRESDDELVHFKDFDENKLLSHTKLEDETAKSNINFFMQARSQLLNKVSFIEKEEWLKKVGIHETLGELTLLGLLVPLAKREEKYVKILSDQLLNYS